MSISVLVTNAHYAGDKCCAVQSQVDVKQPQDGLQVNAACSCSEWRTVYNSTT